MDEEITEATLVTDDEHSSSKAATTPEEKIKMKKEPLPDKEEKGVSKEWDITKATERDNGSPFNHIIAAMVVAIIIVGGTGAYLLQYKSEDVVVNVPFMKIGDKARYSISGSIDIRGAEAEPIGGEVTSASINLKNSFMIVSVDGIETVKDGFFHNYSALKTSTEITYSLQGWAETESYQRVEISGDIQLSENAYRNGNTILLTDITGNSHIRAYSTGFSNDYDSSDHLRSYSSNEVQRKMDEIIHQKNLERGVKGNFTVGEYHYRYEAIDNAYIFDTDCVVVKFWIVDPMPRNLSKQSVKVYLSNKYPFPVRTELEVITTLQGTITVKTTMTMNHFTAGSQPLNIPENTINRTSPFFESGNMGIYPPLGSPDNSSIGDFNITKAHEKAVDESSGLDSYLHAHPDAFLIQGIHNETNGPHWNLTYSYPGATTGYQVISREGRVDDHGEIPLSLAGTDLSSEAQLPEKVLTWAGAGQILKHDSTVKSEAFSGNSLNLGECNIGIRTSLYQPSFDPVSMFASTSQVDYGYILWKGDELAAGVDARNGQILFVATHSGITLF